MKEPLTKHDLVWIITRLIGCYFLWFALGRAIEIAALIATDGPDFPTITFETIRWPVFLLLLFGLLGFYFLRRGEGFVALISTTGNQGGSDDADGNWDDEER